MELATSRHWRLRFGDLALRVNREASDGVQGTGSLPSGYARSGTLGDSLRRFRRRLPKRIVGPTHHVVMPGCIRPGKTGRIGKAIHSAFDTASHTDNRLCGTEILSHVSAPFLSRTLAGLLLGQTSRLAKERWRVGTRFLLRSLLGLRCTAFLLHLRPPILGRRRRAERVGWRLACRAWAAGEEAKPDSPSAADMPVPVCPSRLDFFLADLDLPPPPSAVRA